MYGPYTQCVRIGRYGEEMFSHIKKWCVLWCVMAYDASHTFLSLYTLSLVFVYLDLFL